MASYHDVCTRWVERLTGKTTRPNLTNSRMPAWGDSIFSYGQHFRLAGPIRNRDGVVTHFLLNGDQFSVTTGGHQRHIRKAVENSGLPSVIIPFSALQEAGIEPTTVQIIEVEPERWETKQHVVFEQPEGSTWQDVEIHGYVDRPREELEALVLQRQAWNPNYTIDDIGSYEKRTYQCLGVQPRLFLASGTQVSVEAVADGPTRYTWESYRHWLGESVIRARVTWNKVKTCTACRGASRWSDKPCSKCDSRGRILNAGSRWAYFLSGFDANETRPSYFFCELPRKAKPTTIAEAFESLKPEVVKLAEQVGRPVARQGDIFAIALRGVDKRQLRKQGARFEKRGVLLGQNHEATEVAYLPDGTTMARGTLWHNPEGRAADHKRVRLSDGWHIIVKNEVPLAA